MIRHPLRIHGFWLLVVVLVQFMNVETAATLVHVDSVVAIDGTLYLYGLCSVPLLSVQLASVHGLNVHEVALTTVCTARVVRGRHDGLASRVEPKVGLVHQLLVETRVNRCVVIVHCLVCVVGPRSCIHLRPVLKQFV